MIKRQYMIVFTILLFFIFTLPTLGETKLTDIEGHWGKKAIEKLISIGSISGYPDGTFKPNNPMTVGEFTKVLITSLGSDPGNSNEGHWAMNYVREAENEGIIKTGEFDNYNANITRGEIARMVVRALDESYPSNINEYAGQLTDYNQFPSDMKPYILKAYVKGIITGYPDSTFKHDGEATRAEASAMVIRLLNEEERKTPDLIPEIGQKNETILQAMQYIDGSEQYQKVSRVNEKGNTFKVTVHGMDYTTEHNLRGGHFLLDLEFQNLSETTTVPFGAGVFRFFLYFEDEYDKHKLIDDRNNADINSLSPNYLQYVGNPPQEIELKPGQSFRAVYPFSVLHFFEDPGEEILKYVNKVRISYGTGWHIDTFGEMNLGGLDLWERSKQ